MTINQQNNRGSTLRRLAAIAYAPIPPNSASLPRDSSITTSTSNRIMKWSTIAGQRLVSQSLTFCKFFEAILKPFDTQIYEWGDEKGMDETLTRLAAEAAR